MGWQEPARSTAAGEADRRAHEPGHAYLAETSGDVPRRAETSGDVPRRAETSGDVPRRAETSGDVPLRLGLAPGGARLT